MVFILYINECAFSSFCILLIFFISYFMFVVHSSRFPNTFDIPLNFRCDIVWTLSLPDQLVKIF